MTDIDDKALDRWERKLRDWDISDDDKASIAEAITALRARVKDLEAQQETDHAVITEANNSLYGSQGYFLSLTGGKPNKHHLSEGIERLKAQTREARQVTQEQLDRTADFLKSVYGGDLSRTHYFNVLKEGMEMCGLEIVEGA